MVHRLYKKMPVGVEMEPTRKPYKLRATTASTASFDNPLLWKKLSLHVFLHLNVPPFSVGEIE